MPLKPAASKCFVLTCLTLMQPQRKAEGLPHVQKEMHRRHAVGEQNIGGNIQMVVWSVVVILISTCFPFRVASIMLVCGGQ